MGNCCRRETQIGIVLWAFRRRDGGTSSHRELKCGIIFAMLDCRNQTKFIKAIFTFESSLLSHSKVSSGLDVTRLRHETFLLGHDIFLIEAALFHKVSGKINCYASSYQFSGHKSKLMAMPKCFTRNGILFKLFSVPFSIIFRNTIFSRLGI